MKASTVVITRRATRIVITVLALCAVADWIRPTPAFGQEAIEPATGARDSGASQAASGEEFLLEIGPLALSMRVDLSIRG